MTRSDIRTALQATPRALGFVGFLLLVVTFPLHAQQAEVTHNVNLRADPSTDNSPIRLLTPPEQVELLEPGKTSGYYHVHTSQAEEGWVWAKNVHVIAISPTPTPTPPPVATATPTPAALPTSTATPPSGPASAIDENWVKPSPQEITYTTVNGSCAPAGKAGSDTPTNLLKNRVDVPTSYHDVTFVAIATLSYPHDVTKRIHWQPANLTEIARFEGVPLSVVGYGTGIKMSRPKSRKRENGAGFYPAGAPGKFPLRPYSACNSITALYPHANAGVPVGMVSTTRAPRASRGPRSVGRHGGGRRTAQS
jgi:Bacterial SH3 domain